MGHLDLYFSESFDDGLREGRDYILEKGYRVMTEEFLVKRGYCCSNGCRNCPYWPRAVKGNTTLRDDVKRRYQ